MAEPEEILAGPLRDIAYRVPAECRSNMSSVLELRLRCEYVHDLQSRAANESPDKAERTKRLAERVIRSLSDYSFSAAQADLSERLSDAYRRGDTQGAAEAQMELNSLAHKNPRVPDERVMAQAAAVVGREFDRLAAVPPAPRNHLWNRRRKLCHDDLQKGRPIWTQ